MARIFSIGIVGYGIAGIAAAIQLRRLGHSVVHFERADRESISGAGLLLQPPALALLSELGVVDTLHAQGAPVRRLLATTFSGKSLLTLDYATQGFGEFALGIERSVLLRALSEVDSGRGQLIGSTTVVSVATETGVLATAQGHRHGPFDLIVIADGANSTLRRGFPELIRHDRLYPWAAVTCCLDDPGAAAGDHLLQIFSGTQHTAVWPVGSATSRRPRRLNVAVNVPLSVAKEFLQGGAWMRVAGTHWPALASLFVEQAAALQPAIYSYRDVQLHGFAVGRVVMIGDAAHSMSPQLGQGARMALWDAAQLAQCLQACDDPRAAIAMFDRNRRHVLRRYQRLSRWATPIFQSNNRWLAACRDHLSYPLLRLPYVAKHVAGVLMGE